MLISIKVSRNSAFSGSGKPRMLFFLLINVKMPTFVGILTFMSRKIFMLSWVQHEISFISSEPFFASDFKRARLFGLQHVRKPRVQVSFVLYVRKPRALCQLCSLRTSLRTKVPLAWEDRLTVGLITVSCRYLKVKIRNLCPYLPVKGEKLYIVLSFCLVYNWSK